VGPPERYRDEGEPQPGVAPGSPGRPAGAAFVALYGSVEPHPWCDPSGRADDVWWLLRTRSEEMGWSAEDGTGGLWNVYDAGRDLPGFEAASPLAAWFHVGLEPVPEGRPLPVQPLLCCIDAVMGRLGTLTLEAVQILLPVQGLASSGRRDAAVLPAGTGWFAAADPRSATRVRVTLDSGQVPSLRTAAPQMLAWLDRLEPPTFRRDSSSMVGPDPVAAALPFDDSFWTGPSLTTVTFSGTLADWSLEAVGWLAALLADALARHGVTTPDVLTLSPTLAHS
jgi:hypothetical protein